MDNRQEEELKGSDCRKGLFKMLTKCTGERKWPNAVPKQHCVDKKDIHENENPHRGR